MGRPALGVSFDSLAKVIRSILHVAGDIRGRRPAPPSHKVIVLASSDPEILDRGDPPLVELWRVEVSLLAHGSMHRVVIRLTHRLEIGWVVICSAEIPMVKYQLIPTKIGRRFGQPGAIDHPMQSDETARVVVAHEHIPVAIRRHIERHQRLSRR